ncbi:adhesion G-protein coupled receptor G2-like isoform X1, partial [Clarias magur]
TYTFTTNATTTPPPGVQTISTTTTAHQVITSGLTTNSVVNDSTATAMILQITATGNTTTGTEKPSNTSEVNTTPITTATLLVTDFSNATNGLVSQNLTTTSVTNTSTTTAMILQITATGNTTTGTEKPSNTSEVNTTPITTATPLATDFSSATNANWPVHCKFSQNCDSDSVYYWMTITVEVNGSQTEENISAWLQNLFNNENECIPTLPTVTPSGSTYSTSTTQDVSSVTSSLFITGTLENGSVSSGMENSTNIFKNLTVICVNKTDIRQTTCTVLLQLSQPTNTCCIIQTVNTAQSKSTIQASVVGDSVEQVVKGICHSSAAGWVVGSFEKCNGSLSPDVPCNSNATVNVSCNGNSETAYVSLTIPDQMNSTFENNTNSCNCSSYCSGTAAYYLVDFQTSDFNFNITQILRNPTCNITDPDCQVLEKVAQIYENSTMTCDTSLKRCTIILKLSKPIDVCSLSSALLATFQNQSSTVINGTVTRVAICIWEDGLNTDLLQSNILPMSLLFPDVCSIGQETFILNYCKKGTNIAVPLMATCNTIPGNSASTGMPPSTANSIVTTASDTATLTVSDSSTNAEATAESLLNLSRNASSLNSTQIQQIVSLLESVLSGPTISLALGNLSINIVSNLIDAPPDVLASSSNRIIGIVDTVGLKLVVQGQTQTILSPSVALAVKLLKGSVFPGTTFIINDPSNLQIDPMMKGTELSSPQGSITLPASLTENLTLQEQQLASRVQFNFYQKTTLFQDTSLNMSQLLSGVLGSTVANLSISNLRDLIVFTLRNTETFPVNITRSCVFWKFDVNGGSGAWSTDGCTVLNYTETETICGCNHMTSFGVLLDLSRGSINSPLQNIILTYITYIGCGISAIFLSVTLMTYLAFETLRKDIPSKIVIQLCLALLLLNLTFLLDAWLALYPNIVGLCISTAFFLHYFLLASFTWMAMEAIHMYLALVKVFNTYVSRFMVKLGLAGWGIPLIVVIIVIAIDKNNYGLVSYGKFEDGTSDEFCWLQNDTAYYVAVVAYFCVCFLLNLSMFIVVMVQLCRIKRQNPHNLQHRSILQDLRSVAGLTVLLGLTWGFAFFAWDAVNLPFMYLFAIFNTLQGFFIFVFHCAVKENVRRQWKIHLCCGNLRLVENSDWSHTATQKIKKSTVNRIASSFRSVKSSKSNNSSSTFLVTDSTGLDRSMGI